MTALLDDPASRVAALKCLSTDELQGNIAELAFRACNLLMQRACLQLAARSAAVMSCQKEMSLSRVHQSSTLRCSCTTFPRYAATQPSQGCRSVIAKCRHSDTADLLHAPVSSASHPDDISAGKPSEILSCKMLFGKRSCTLVCHRTDKDTSKNDMQAVSKIEGLEACARLEQLWLTESEIQVIEGLQGCTQLRRLYLYSNQIPAIQGLEKFSQLEVLSSKCNCTQMSRLYTNLISTAQALNSLVHLRCCILVITVLSTDSTMLTSL